MPRKSKGNNRRGAKGASGSRGRAMKRGSALVIAGPWGTRLSVPRSCLPFLVGSDKNLSAGLSVYPVIHGLSVPIKPFKFQMTAGAVAQQLAISTTMLQDFATRLGATFDEYCITGASFEVRYMSTGGNQQGLVYAYLDEKDSTTPTAANAQNSPRLDITCANEALPIRHRIDWLPADYVDLDWTSTASLTTPCYVKVFASVADTLTSSDLAGFIYFTGALTIDVRGWKA